MTMPFGPEHYVPVLKLKRAEAKAMTLLDASIRSALTPLFEVVELGDSDNEDEEVEVRATIGRHIEKAVEYLTEVVEDAGVNRYFLDCRSIANEGPDATRAIIEGVSDLGAWCVPVTGITRDDDGLVELATESGAGIALRLTRDDLRTGRVKRELLSWVKTHAFAPSSVDVIMDLGAVGDMVEDGVQSEMERFLSALPTPLQWRTLTISAVAFSPSGVETSSTARRDRLDWRVWRDHVHARGDSLARVPTFSDGAVQHPRGVENIPVEILRNFAPTIRYATADEWLIIKGVGGKARPHKEQFPDMAAALIANAAFRGPRHCKGCSDAERAAHLPPKFGNQESWLRIGAIHHLTSTVEQLRALPSP
jgi:hypothetical protein